METCLPAESRHVEPGDLADPDQTWPQASSLICLQKQRASSLSLPWESRDAVGSLLLGGATVSDVGDGTSAAALPPFKMKFSDHETRSRKMRFL